jgi:TrmH family RNA methyltransferase
MGTDFILLSARDNPRLKRLAALASSARERRERGQTLIDGAHLLDAALNAGILPLEVCVSESGRKQPEILALLDRLPAGFISICIPDALFTRISPLDTPTGILASIGTPAPGPQEMEDDDSIVVLDTIQDPGNLGTILRTTAAAGIGQVWLTAGCAQAWSPKVLRAGMGAHFRLRIHEQIDAPARLADWRGKVVATGVDTNARTPFDTDLRGPLVWLFGAEGQGLSPALRARADEILNIPMAEGIESLNVAAAVAICLFEQLRQSRISA